MQKSSIYHAYIYFIFFVKVLFLLAIIGYIYAKKFYPEHSEKVKAWKDFLENIFIMLMAILVIYLFSHNSIIIEREERLLFVIFGVIIASHAYRGIFPTTL